MGSRGFSLPSSWSVAPAGFCFCLQTPSVSTLKVRCECAAVWAAVLGALGPCGFQCCSEMTHAVVGKMHVTFQFLPGLGQGSAGPCWLEGRPPVCWPPMCGPRLQTSYLLVPVCRPLSAGLPMYSPPVCCPLSAGSSFHCSGSFLLGLSVCGGTTDAACGRLSRQLAKWGPSPA